MKEMHYFSYLSEILFKNWKLFVSYESRTKRLRRHKREITIRPVNTLCVFFILALKKERARWLKTHNLFWKAYRQLQKITCTVHLKKVEDKRLKAE